MQLTQKKIVADGETLVCEYALRDKNAVILHGAGHSERKRHLPIAHELLRNNIGVVVFDFSGHGESTGKTGELSLARRKTQAQAVIDTMLPPQSPLYLLGFSMSGQTVCDLLPLYPGRIESILLGAPAMYTPAVQGIPFGDPSFTATIRQAESWQNSHAPKALQQFSGKTVLAIGDQDEVIPPGVINLFKSSAQEMVYVEYTGVSHKISVWLGKNPQALAKLIKTLTSHK